MFQPKCSPIGNHSAPLRHMATQNSTPHKPVLTMPSHALPSFTQFTPNCAAWLAAGAPMSRLPRCIRANSTAKGIVTRHNPKAPASNWKA